MPDTKKRDMNSTTNSETGTREAGFDKWLKGMRECYSLSGSFAFQSKAGKAKRMLVMMIIINRFAESAWI